MVYKIHFFCWQAAADSISSLQYAGFLVQTFSWQIVQTFNQLIQRANRVLVCQEIEGKITAYSGDETGLKCFYLPDLERKELKIPWNEDQIFEEIKLTDLQHVKRDVVNNSLFFDWSLSGSIFFIEYIAQVCIVTKVVRNCIRQQTICLLQINEITTIYLKIYDMNTYYT